MNRNGRNTTSLGIPTRKVKVLEALAVARTLEALAVARTLEALAIFLICSLGVEPDVILMHPNREQTFNLPSFWILKKLFSEKIRIFAFQKKRIVKHVMDREPSREQKQIHVRIVMVQAN